MEIQTIRKGFAAFESNSNHLKGIWAIQMQIPTISKGIRSIQTKFEAFECK